MKRQYAPVAAALLAVGAWAAPAAADKQYDYGNRQQQQTSQKQRQSRQQTQRQASQAQGDQKRIATVNGRLVGLREVKLRGEKQPHVLAKLQTRDGRTVVVDLGTRQDVRGMRFARNQELSAMGPAGRINGKPVIVADKFRDLSRRNQPTITIVRIIPIDVARQRQAHARSRQQQQQTGQQGQARARGFNGAQGSTQAQLPGWHPDISSQRQTQARLVNGRVTDKREVSIKGQSQKHLLVKIQTPRGRTALLDLGTANNASLKDVNLNKGEFISAIGRMGRINGRPVLVADHVAEIVTIDRGQSGTGQQGEATQASASQSGSAAGNAQSGSSPPSQGQSSAGQQQQAGQ